MKQTSVIIEDESSKDRKREDDKRQIFAIKFTWISLACGCFIFLFGIVLFGLVFKLEDAHLLINNKNKSQRSTSLVAALILKTVSPFLCGIGVFSIIISCVVKLEIYQQKVRLREVFEVKSERLSKFRTIILQKYLNQINHKKKFKPEDEFKRINQINQQINTTVKTDIKRVDIIQNNYLIQKNIKAHLDINNKSRNKNPTIQHILSAVEYLPLFLGITDAEDKTISRKSSTHKSKESLSYLSNESI